MNPSTVSIGIAVWNGEAFLAKSLDSLLAQDYLDIELIILDNQSTDRTAEICRAYAGRDRRLRYVLDDARRGVEEAYKKIAELATGSFFMTACDDDLYAPNYVSTLVAMMRANPDVGLAYSGLGYVFPDGTRKQVNLRKRYFLKSGASKAYNFAFYFLHRCPVPVTFGLTRTDLHREALRHFYRVDKDAWDQDNLYVLRLLSLAKADSTSECLFYYRQRDRVALYTQRGQLPQKRPPRLARYLTENKHQAKFTMAAFKIVDEGPFSFIDRGLLKVWGILVFASRCTLGWLLGTQLYMRLRKPVTPPH